MRMLHASAYSRSASNMASPGFLFAALVTLSCCAALTCDPSSNEAECPVLAYCKVDTCICNPGTVPKADGTCASQGYSVRAIYQFALADIDTEAKQDVVKAAFAFALMTPSVDDSFRRFGVGPPPQLLETMVFQTDPDDPTIVTLDALFETRPIATNALDGKDDTLFVDVGYDSIIWSPKVYFYVSKTSSNAIQLQASGLTVTDVFFDINCADSSGMEESNGCWKIDILYTTGKDESMNVLYVPKADDGVVEDFSDRLDPSQFPCGSFSLTQDNDLSQKTTSCCMLPFLDQYRVNKNFFDHVAANWEDDIVWNTGPEDCKTMEASDFEDADTGKGYNFVTGKIEGMPMSKVVAMGVTNPVLNQRQAQIWFDEEELRNLTSKRTGTIGVEYTLDLWIGIAEFSTTDQALLDSQMKHVEIHLEKSDYFTVSSFGTINPGEAEVCCGTGCEEDEVTGVVYCPEDQIGVTCIQSVSINPGGLPANTDICCPYAVGTPAYDDHCTDCDPSEPGCIIQECSAYYDSDGVLWVPPIMGPDGEITNPDYNMTIVGDGICCIKTDDCDNNGEPDVDKDPTWGDFCDARCATSCPPTDPECNPTCSLVFWAELTRNPEDWAPGGDLEGDDRQADWTQCCVEDFDYRWKGPKFRQKAAREMACFPCTLTPSCRCDNSCCEPGDPSCPNAMIADINLRVHEILDPADQEGGEKMQYLQVTFTTGYQYGPGPSGAIALSSVQIWKGDFIANPAVLATGRQSCLGNDNTWAEVGADFLARQASDECTPNAVFCEQIDSLADQFVSFNVPLGKDFFEIQENGGLMADDNIFLAFTLTLENLDTQQLASTQVKAQIPLIVGGVNSWCAERSAAADLQGVAHVDLMVGTAMNETELARLWMRENIEQTNQSDIESVQVDTVSIQSSIMTLVLKGDENYFTQPATGRFKLEVEDIITLHIMENGDGDVYQEVLNLVQAGQAFDIQTEQAGHYVHLEPSVALSEYCSFFPEPATKSNIIPAVCVARRDLKHRAPQTVSGGVRTAMEVLSRTNDDWTDCEAFMTDIFGSSDYATNLGREFGKLVVGKWPVNNRYVRAWWINPGYEWTKASTGGTLNKFTLSQKLFMFALINLNEDFISRRMLLATTGRDGASDMSAQSFAFDVDSMQLIANVLGVDRNMVTQWSLTMGLTDEQACYSEKSLKDLLRGKLNVALENAVSESTKVLSVQILGMDLQKDSLKCTNRRTEDSRRAVGTATAKVSAAIVFDGASMVGMPSIDISKLEASEYIVDGSVAAVDAPGVVVGNSKSTTMPQTDEEEADEEEAGGKGTSSTTILAAVLGSIGGVILIAAIVVGVKMANARKTDEQNVHVQEATDLSELKTDLKSQLDPSVAGQF